ncbi:hypothetical protein Avbf_15466 [Armadillidium vulgare]|nr:hypothetical protein Avbf_15466 [Armadillidium vulgare]
MRIPSSISCSSLCLNKDKCQTYDYKGKFCTLYEGITQVEPDETTGAYTSLTEDELQSLTTDTTTTTTTAIIRTPTQVHIPMEQAQNRYMQIQGYWINFVQKITWEEALEYCKENDYDEARLLVVRNEELINVITTYASQGQKFWIGLNDSDNEKSRGFRAVAVA